MVAGRASPTAPTRSTTSRSSRWPPSTSPARDACSTSAAARARSRASRTAAGAQLVVGVDPTWAQVVEGASTWPAVRCYARAEASALPFADASFDAVVACLVFEHIVDVDSAIAEVGRVLEPGGRFLFFLNHPLLQTPGSGWIDDHILDPPEQYWRIGPYLVESIEIEEIAKDVHLPYVHRPLSRYVNALAAAGHRHPPDARTAHRRPVSSRSAHGVRRRGDDPAVAFPAL